MARYSATLRELISTLGIETVKNCFLDYKLSDYLTQKEISTIQNRGVWTPVQLADRIINQFYLREIGFESFGEFKLHAKNLMAELMESYAPLIYSASIEYDPLVNVDFTEVFDRTSDNSSISNSTSQNNGKGLVINSDTPQGEIDKNEILQGKYASSTSATENESQMTDESKVDGNGSEHYEKRTKGNSGVSATAQKMIEQYRDNIRAINTEIIYRLEPLFMGIY